ncbi:MAG TPA: hypothetical protein VH703_01655 [Solirubrobacterales bacterium]|jgi:hypothetical protein
MIAAISAGEIGALAGGVAALGGLVGVWVGVREYKLKSKAQRVESDVSLHQLITELMQTANGRGPSVLSDSAAEAIAQAWIERGASMPEISEALDQGVVTYPVGEAAQAAAIASIGSLGVEHPTLREPALRALLALKFVEGREHLAPARQAALAAVEAVR